MTNVAISEFKAKMSHYLRLVKSGEELELRDRGVSVALIVSSQPAQEELSIPAQKPPGDLARMKFTVKPTLKGIDIVDFLLEDRRKR